MPLPKDYNTSSTDTQMIKNDRASVQKQLKVLSFEGKKDLQIRQRHNLELARELNKIQL